MKGRERKGKNEGGSVGDREGERRINRERGRGERRRELPRERSRRRRREPRLWGRRHCSVSGYSVAEIEGFIRVRVSVSVSFLAFQKSRKRGSNKESERSRMKKRVTFEQVIMINTK